MRRLALDIDPVAYVRNLLGNNDPDPIQALILAELGGAESIVCYLRDDLKTVNERDITLFRQVVKSYLNVRTNLTEENIRKLIRIKPDMITFVAPGDISSVEADAINLDTYASQLEKYITELRSNNILSAVLVDPDISQIKLAGRLEFDYVELKANSLTEAQDMGNEIQAIENLSGLVMASGKLGLGVNISGGIGYDNLRDISEINFIEDIVIGKPIFTKALAIGFEQAVRDALTLM